MATPAWLGFGVTLSYGSTQGGSYTLLAEIKDDFEFPALEVGVVQNTNHDSANFTHTAQPGLIKPGSFDLKLVYAGTQHNTLLGFLRTIKWWKIIGADGSTEIFSGFISKIGRSAPLENVMETEVTIQLSTKPVFTAGS